MKPASDPSGSRSDVIVSFFIPQAMLEILASTDTREVRINKMTRNNAWLARWLPVYIVRWSLLFAGSFTITCLVTELGMPFFVIWICSLGQYACAGMATYCIGLYLHIRFGGK